SIEPTFEDSDRAALLAEDPELVLPEDEAALEGEGEYLHDEEGAQGYYDEDEYYDEDGEYLEEGTTEGSDDEEYYDEDFDDSDEGASNR
ncbi:MAG: hypothetical protein KC561_18440, partial [Myxococcales bacterium]|nr:hypothetical protein [Myxococcales bacterium]